ncbi:lectin-like domain-containing protein [Mycolicibacterium diernhoferi]|nr:PQQ-dependent sugar dehydrogenase [Mycolicibacterium diernhoferi]QYL21856.1 PQQ-dependent sugar dehydrogenase [Mycolicibacterium diernhoferi]
MGALAVALGIGGVIVGAPGAAWAEETTSTPSSSSSDSRDSSESTSPAPKSTSNEPAATGPTGPSPDDGSGDDPDIASALPAGATDDDPPTRTPADDVVEPDREQSQVVGADVAPERSPESPTAPTRWVAPAGKNSDARRAVSPTAPTRTAAPADSDSVPGRFASRPAVAPASGTRIASPRVQLPSNEVPVAADQTTEWSNRTAAAVFAAPTGSTPGASEEFRLVGNGHPPVHDPGPIGLDSSAMWAVLGSAARRHFSEQVTGHAQLAGLAQTLQGEPLGQVDEQGPAALIEQPTTSIFFESSPTVGEAAGTVLIPIVRTGDLTRESTIEYGITSDTATAGVDYIGQGGTITMGVNVDRVFISVQIVNDTLAESTETFVVSIINVDSGSRLLYPRTARVDILDDETPVVDPPSPPLTSNYNVTQQVVASGLGQPLAMEFSSHDPSLIYVAEKGGIIKVVDTDTGVQTVFVDISAKVNNIQDRGLMDIVLHPNFGKPGLPGNSYLYAFYVVDPAGTAGQANANARPDGGGNRFAYLVRFTADAATNYTTAVPNSEVILLGGAPAAPGGTGLTPRTLQDISGAGVVDSTSNFSQAESGFNAQTGQYVDNYIKVDSLSHAGGSMAFGPDGALYVSIGDGTSFNATDPRSVSVQNINSLSGKILRIDPLTGLGLSDNPFVKPGDDLNANHAKVYQLGLRNPFSIGFAEDGRLFMANTGWFSWEEIESGHAGANFGWPYFEGGDNGVLLKTPGYDALPADAARNAPSAAAFYAAVANGTIKITPAYRAFSHDPGAPGFQAGAIVGVDAAYTGSRYPAEFRNDIFFTDVNAGTVFVADANNRSDVKFLYRSTTVPIAFKQGPDGYMYVANMAGTITRLLIESKNPPPSDSLLSPKGSATVANNVFTLTRSTYQAGAAMSTQRIDMRHDFTLAFDINLGTNDSGGDGAALVFHNDPRGVNAIGTTGSGLGVGGIQNGLAIEFDTYNSTTAHLNTSRMPGADIAADHTGFLDTDGTYASTPTALPNLENGAWRTVVVTWNATTQTMSYTINGQPTATPLTANIINTFLGDSNYAHIGFTAGTGGRSNTQSIRNFTLAATYEGQAPAANPPFAGSDTATTQAGKAVTINVLANDSDPDNDPLTLIEVTNPVNGTATRNIDNTITYTPRAGFFGFDGFSYTISDGTMQRSAQVSVTVTPQAGVVLSPKGSATVANNVFTLTKSTYQAGAAMSTQRIDMRHDFTLAFDINLGTNDSGGDGAALVFHNDPRGVNAIGTTGSGLGVGGIQNGLAIEFDTYNSTTAHLNTSRMPGADIAADHTGFLDTDGTYASTPTALPNLENGAWRTVVVTWNATTQTMSYTINGQPTATPLTANIINTFLGDSNYAHIGFTAGTGGRSNTQSIRNFTLAATYEGQAPTSGPGVGASVAPARALKVSAMQSASERSSSRSYRDLVPGYWFTASDDEFLQGVWDSFAERG